MKEQDNRRTIRVVLYTMLVVSSAAAFVLTDSLWAAARTGEIPVWTPLLAPGAFTIFVALFAVDRWRLVQRHHYPMTRAIFQVAFGVLFLTLLWPHQTTELRTTKQSMLGGDTVARLLHHTDGDVRALACETAGLKARVELAAPVENLAQHDPLPGVRQRCAEALGHLTALGSDGTP